MRARDRMVRTVVLIGLQITFLFFFFILSRSTDVLLWSFTLCVPARNAVGRYSQELQPNDIVLYPFVIFPYRTLSVCFSPIVKSTRVTLFTARVPILRQASKDATRKRVLFIRSQTQSGLNYTIEVNYYNTVINCTVHACTYGTEMLLNRLIDPLYLQHSVRSVRSLKVKNVSVI